LTIYIREAHPTDEWQMTVNETEGVCYPQPRTTDERVSIAKDFVRKYHYSIPMLVDPIENPADQLYAGWPERIYIIGADRSILFKGELGPFGFDLDGLETWLAAR